MSVVEENFESVSYLSELLEIQQRVVAQIALSGNLHETLDLICRGIEQIFSESAAKSSVLLLNGNQLLHGAAPSLPKAYCDIIDGVTIGPSVGSCGTAAFSKSRYVAQDISSDPKWVNFKSVAQTYQLAACWSTPIISTDNKVLGTFAVYYDYPNAPTASELKVIDRFTNLTGLAIEKDKSFTRERELNTELEYSHSKILAITHVLPDQLYIYDEDARCVDFYGSDASKRFTPSKNLMGQLVLSNGVDHCTSQDAIARTLQTGDMHIFEYQKQRNGKTYYFESRITPVDEYLIDSRKKSYVLWLVRDITDRKEAEQKIQELAYHDLLTNLPNRRYLLNQLQKLMEKAALENSIGALLYLDLDNFKGVNDSMGHSAGDTLLKDICSRLSIKLNPNDTFARIGGDEFVILLSEFSYESARVASMAANMSEILMAQLSKPFDVCGRNVIIEASIGITLIGSDETHADEILMRADTAMYSAKRTAQKNYCFFDPALHESLKKRFEIESQLKDAINKREIVTYFQPQVTANGELQGVEALVRWNHPDKRLVSPIEFVAVAEEIGVIDSLQRVVMEDCCALFRTLQSQGRLTPNFRVSINMSAIQFRNVNLSEDLTQLFLQEGVAPSFITLELTESMLVEEIDGAIKQMQALKAKGFRLSIDDFGTGYSSLAYLQTFPIDELKIDKSFLDKMDSANIGTGIIDTIITLAEHLNFEVVAEGVEHQGQLDYLRQKHITAMQGYFFARPMPAESLYEWIEDDLDNIY
ncbi:EAL domain-containing protein [Alginatibacterium sediminis]|uniref:EAL domain-containing protein n=1 Tax=Alginatibacterium sediminis TaxID=2164068 RepID=A0A420EGT2_9ALTE|nr:EAL domain-containing protein [Alginatibacterium sediminis]RKF19870.1 EAL domain-containing protein [Alginatibacterium sediminis]